MIVWKLDEVLRLKGVKGRELARRMEIGENYLSRVRHEVPDRLSLSLLDGLCRELDCSIGDLLEFRPDKPVAKKRAAKKVAPAAPVDDDFGSIVAEALGEALQEEPAVEEPVVEAPMVAPVVAPVVEPVVAPVAPPPVVAPVVVPVAEAAPEPTPEPAPEVAPETSKHRPPETPAPSFAPMVIPIIRPGQQQPEVPQQRWGSEPVPEAHLAPPVAPVQAEPAPAPQEEAPAAPADEAEAAGVPAAVLKGGALGARLNQLRRQRPT